MGVLSVTIAPMVALIQPAEAAPAVGALSSAQAAALSTNVNQRVIVLFKNQLSGEPATAARVAMRRSAESVMRRSVLSELTQTHARNVHAYTLINAVAATVSSGEKSRLAADPDVAAVVPDRVIQLNPNVADTSSARTASGASYTPPAGSCPAHGAVQLGPEAIRTIRYDGTGKTPNARSLGITGAGTKVAFIADGLDIKNPDFIRANGQHVFVDYKDFTGEGTSVPTGGGEAFLDASSIAAQGRIVYNVSKFSSLAMSAPCKVRIEGDAPGTKLVGLDIFGAEDAGFNSSFLQAIDYAVSVDHVNVLNESLGVNAFPDDQGSLDLVKQANDAAVAAGTVVVASSGDAGVTNTIGSPATDPHVISAGASTTYQFDVQAGYGGAEFGVRGWLNDNISMLSSSGFTQAGRSVDMVAPGELNWALCSTNTKQYSECTSYTGQPSAVQAGGGTSEASPLIAGAAADVIQAYRRTHRGHTPSPALVKRILTSTADDIGAPADEQGSGRLDVYRAVLAAEAYGRPKAKGGSLLVSSPQVNAIGKVGSYQTLSERVTNNSGRTQKVAISTRTLGVYRLVAGQTVILSDADSPKRPDYLGATDNFSKVQFAVGRGVSRLKALIAWQGTSASGGNSVRVTLVDPKGRLASYSLPQGNGNAGRAEVANPMAGTWTAYVWSHVSADGGYVGSVAFNAMVASFQGMGTVSPSTLTLRPGASATVRAKVALPRVPGDRSASLVLRAPVGTTTAPLLLRSLIPTGATKFTSTLWGGNGREVSTGQTAYYQVDIAKNTPELHAMVTLQGSPNNDFYAWLVDPSGQAEAFASNTDGTINVDSQGNPIWTDTLGANLHVVAPKAGRWTLIVDFAPTVSGKVLREPFQIALDERRPNANMAAIPATIAKGATQLTHITVTNNTTSPEAYFVDPRFGSTARVPLIALNDSSTSVPLSVAGNIPLYLLPTGVSSVSASAMTTGSTPIQFDFGTAAGDPDVASPVGHQVALKVSGSPLTQGPWSLAPTTPTAHGAQPVSGGDVSTSVTATMNPFNTDITSPTNDLWMFATDARAPGPNAVIVQPGHSATIPVSITPTRASGTVESGKVYLDEAELRFFGSIMPNGNQVAAFPYSFKVG